MFAIIRTTPISTTLADKPADGRRDDRVRQVDFQFVEPRLGLRELCARQIELRDRRLVARIGVVEGLLGNELPLVQVARAIEVRLGQTQVGFTLTDGGLRDVVGCHRLLDLLLQFAVLDLGNGLPAGHAIAETHGNGFEPAGNFGSGFDGLRAHQITDDADFGGHVGALDRRGFDRHRLPLLEAATTAEVAALEAAATLEAAAALAAASLIPLAATCLAAASLVGGQRVVATPDVIRPEADDGDENPNDQNRTFHDAPCSAVMATLARITVRES
jgi:hypothetical protein